MRKIFLLFTLLLILTGCKTQFHAANLISTDENISEVPENKYNEKVKDSLTIKKKVDYLLNAKINPVLVKNALVRKKNINEALEFDMSLFVKKAAIIECAKHYLGTKYYYGGMTEKGIDCSALILNAFKMNAILLPRTSLAQAALGLEINIQQADIGDLIFFKTTRRNVISHVGIIVENLNGIIKFIHASSSKGVTISSLENDYFKNRFVEIKRIIN